MTRGSHLAVAAVVVAAAGGVATAVFVFQQRARPPSVLLITVDTLRADALSAYGNASARTPVLDRLAREGALFEQVLSQAPATGPSTASLLTSRYPVEHGALYNTRSLPRSERTIAEYFHGLGYVTAAFVSATILHSRYGFAQGFDLYDQTVDRSYGGHGYERDSADTIDAAIRTLDVIPERPFFLWVHLFDPHAPYRSHEGVRGEETWGTRQSLLALAKRGRAAIERALPSIRSLYAGEVSYVDTGIGRLLEALEDRGRRGDTLVVVTADHGEELFDHGAFHGHYRSLSQSVLRVPLLFQGPGVPRGRRVRSRVENVDVFPTIAALVGGPAPPGVSGRDLSVLLHQTVGEVRVVRAQREPVEDLPGGLGFAALRDRWKLVWYTREGASLFDLEADPMERRDVVASHPAIAADLRARLEPWLDGTLGSLGSRDPDSLSRRDRELLQALGYLEEPTPEPAP